MAAQCRAPWPALSASRLSRTYSSRSVKWRKFASGACKRHAASADAGCCNSLHAAGCSASWRSCWSSTGTSSWRPLCLHWSSLRWDARLGARQCRRQPAARLCAMKVRVPLPHLGTVFVDELLWDLTAPRAACEGYVSEVTNDLRLDWQSHAVILRYARPLFGTVPNFSSS